MANTTTDNPALQAQQKRRGIAVESSDTKDYSLILGLLPQKEAEDEDEEDLRELFASVLCLFYAEAQKHLSNTVREVELLRSAPPRPPVQYTSQGPRPSTSADETWKLDTLLPLGGPDGKGPLLDRQGKVRMDGLSSRGPHDCLTAPSPLHYPSVWSDGKGTVTGRGFQARSQPPHHDHRRVLRRRAAARKYHHWGRVSYYFENPLNT